MHHRRLTFYLFLSIANILFNIDFVFANQGSEQKEILESASELDYPPFAVVRPDGSADGFSVDLLKAVVNACDLDVKITVGPWHEIKKQLAEHRLDVLPLVGYSPDRDKVFDFTVPYLQMRGAIFVREGTTDITSETDLLDKEVLVMRGDNAHEYAVNNNLSKHLILTSSYKEALQLLSSGKHDAVLCQYLMGLQLIKKLGITNVVNISTPSTTSLKPRSFIVSGFEQKFCIAVPEGENELLARLNEGLAIIIADGTYEKLYQKWFSPILPEPSVPLTTIITSVFIVLLPISLFLAIAGIWYLRRKVSQKTRNLIREIEERQELENRYKKILEISIDGFWICDRNGKLTDINNAYCAMSGYERNELLQMSIMDLEAAQSESEIKGSIAKIIKLGSLTFESKHRHKNGAIINVEVSTTFLPERGGAFFSIVRNITDRKQAEKKLAQSEERFRLHFQNAPMPYQSLNFDGFLIDINPAWLEVMGYERDEVIGKSFGEFLISEMKEHFKYNFPRFKDKGEILGVEFEMVKKDGSIIMVRFNGRIGYDDNGNFKQTHCIFHDITEIRRTENEKKLLEIRLRQAQKMEAIGTLAGGIAHDFNNILAAILGYTEMAKDDVPAGTQLSKDLDQILHSANRAKALVKQILDFSRQSNIERIRLRIQPILEEALKMLKSSIPATINITQDIDPQCGVILADPTQLHQIVMNLCTNAYHAMERTGGTLSITLKTTLVDSENEKKLSLLPGEYVEFSVTDSGEGIGPDIIDKIFDPYFTTKDTGKGTGMGLAIIHGIIKEYGGTITVESQLAIGSTFNVFFPVIVKETLREKQTPQDIPSGQEHILFVDDEAILAKMGKSMLERLGYQVTVSLSGVEALTTFHNTPDTFDLVITDQTMPNMSGSDLAHRLMQIRPDIPVILCTGYSSNIDEQSAELLGIKGFAFKPFSKQVIAKLVRKALDAD